MSRADKQRKKEILKRIRKVKGRGHTPIPPTKVIPNKKKEITVKELDKEVKRYDKESYLDGFGNGY